LFPAAFPKRGFKRADNLPWRGDKFKNRDVPDKNWDIRIKW